MKTPARVVLLLLAGLSLAGCASQTAHVMPETAPKVASWGEQPLSSRDYWYKRDLEDRADRVLLGAQR